MAAWNIENSLDSLVTALCYDYERRKKAISSKTNSYRTDTEHRYLNYKIFAAAAEIVGDEDAEQIIREIGKKIGYAKSEFYTLSEVTYKKYKRLVRDNIARKLNLVD